MKNYGLTAEESITLDDINVGVELVEIATGHVITVSELTELGFKYIGVERLFIPRWGLSFTGSGEVFCFKFPDALNFYKKKV